jgi:L-alanine-DL-glutamate epimerase-like enolase superfamily enzyme
MKITAVESLVLLRRYHLVRVRTDEGITGIGEVSPMAPGVTDALVRELLTPIVVGQDPLQIERLWHEMYHKSHKAGPMGVLLEAMAGIDIALWDIAGKAANLPLYALLGGKFRDRPRVYASSMRRDMTPEEEADRAVEYKEKGYPAYKMHSATRWAYDDGFDQTVDTVRAIRKAVGDDFDIMVDVNNAYLPATALKVARQLEEYGVWHFEEPLAAHDRDGYAELAAAVDIPIAAGEQEYTRWQFRDLILHNKVDILQPDVVKCGGITEWKKIAAVCQAFNKPITVHNTQPTVGTVAHLHLWASTPNCVYPQEYNIEPHPLRDDSPILTEPLTVVDGRLTPPEGPGLGISLDEGMLAKLAAQ